MASNKTLVRAFDLGGSGLKTGLFQYDSYGMWPSVGSCRLLGKFNPERGYRASAGRLEADLAGWLRAKVPELEGEVAQGNVLFGFSLAGLDKLFACDLPDGWISSIRRNPTELANAVARWFALPRERVVAVVDGDAHLMAAIRTHRTKQYPVLAFSVGTGVGIAMTNSKGLVRGERALKVWAGGMDPSLLNGLEAEGGRADLWYALGGQGLSERLGGDAAEFKRRWGRFLEQVALPMYDRVPKVSCGPWTRPKTIYLSGGVVDSLGTLMLPSSAASVPVVQGPRDAGLLGAAWVAVKRVPYDQR